MNRRTFRYVTEGMDGNGGNWVCTGLIDVFPEDQFPHKLMQVAFAETARKLTGDGCKGPYKFEKFLFEKFAVEERDTGLTE